MCAKAELTLCNTLFLATAVQPATTKSMCARVQLRVDGVSIKPMIMTAQLNLPRMLP